VPVRRWLGTALLIAGLGASAIPAAAQGDDDEEDEDRGGEDDDEDRGGDDEDEDRGDDEDGGIRANRPDDEAEDGGGGGDDGGGGEEADPDFERQKDHTRPGGGRSDQNQFQRERFFVDKEESAKTAKGTLIQGSFTSSNFVYRESGGALGGTAGTVGATSNSQFSRYFTDLRAQIDAMHLGGSRWDFRLDGRVRFTADPGQATQLSIDGTDFPTRVQSGMFGRNEYELKEMWFVRGGERADVFVGRQYVTDLGAIKIDGIRIDYASSPKFTLIGFAGAYPYRGSRSIGLDYIEGKDDAGESVGRVIPIAAGGGAAYRTEKMYGSFGGAAIVPLKGEQPRVYGTSSGYWRTGPKLDFYHFAIIDLYGSAGFAITNLSLGVNAKPAQRIRLNAAVNRVDTETLNVTAQAYLSDPEPGRIRNDTTIQRVASDQARGGVSVSLGQTQQIEVSTSLTYRRRPEVKLTDGMTVLQTISGMKRADESCFGSASYNPSTSLTRVRLLHPKHSASRNAPASVRCGGMRPMFGGCSHSE
jgi:hypothetical protein